ncbi:MAG: hypothetical protein ABIN61_00410 [candidate division WOR-3 bacterium]
MNKYVDWEQAFYIASSGSAKISKILPSSEHKETDTLFGGELTIKAKIEKGFMEIESTGKFKKEKVTVLSEYGSKLDSSIADVRIILETTQKPEIYGYINGNIMVGEKLPSLNITAIKEKISLFTAYIQSPFKADTELFSPQIFNDKKKVPEKEIIFVNDVVFFQSDTFDYKKTIISSSDIIIENGILKNLTLIAYGEVRIQNDSKLYNVSIFSANSVILSGYSYFSGEIISENEIRVAEFSQVENSSVLIAYGETNQIKFTESASFCGSAISIAEKTIAGGYQNIILVEKYAKCKGLLYSTGKINIQGKLEGLLCAHSLYGRSSNGHYGNVLEGEIIGEIPESICLSYYLNTQKIKRKSWKLM